MLRKRKERRNRLLELEAARRRIIASWQRARGGYDPVEEDDYALGYYHGLSVALGHVAPEVIRHPSTGVREL